MADVLLNRKELSAIMEDGRIDTRYLDCVDIGFVPIPFAIDVMEKEKKGKSRVPSDIKRLINLMPKCVNTIPLSQKGLYEAMSNQDFLNKYTNRVGNPAEFATEASLYEYEGWWDRTELLDSFHELSWI